MKIFPSVQDSNNNLYLTNDRRIYITSKCVCRLWNIDLALIVY